MSEEKEHPSEYLNDLEEWQNHQYDPGHYLGENLPPQLKNGLGTVGGKYLGVLFLIIGVMSGIGTIFSLVKGTGDLVGLFVFILFITAGITLLRGRR